MISPCDLTVHPSLCADGAKRTEDELRKLALDDIEELQQESVVDLAEEGDEDLYACPKSTHWTGESKEKDLYIDSPTMTVLAMDGKRRWLDIKRMVSTKELLYFSSSELRLAESGFSCLEKPLSLRGLCI